MLYPIRIAYYIYLLLFLSVYTTSVHAEPVAPLTHIRQLTFDGNSIAPVFSPTDKALMAFTQHKYKGIYLLSTKERQQGIGALSVTPEPIKPLTKQEKSGFNFSWAQGGKNIIFRGQDEKNKTRHTGMVSIEKQQYIEFSGAAKTLSVPTVNRNTITFVQDKQEVSVDISQYQQGMTGLAVAPTAPAPSIYARDGRIWIDEETVSPATAQCWLPVVAPDGDKVVFECWEGLYVYQLSNQVLFFLDAGSSPRWGQDSTYLVYEQTEDDGHVITRADAFRIRYDGSEKHNLTANLDALVRRPSLSHDGQHIAFDIQGNIFIANIATKKESR